jgi:hypothetical protein
VLVKYVRGFNTCRRIFQVIISPDESSHNKADDAD